MPRKKIKKKVMAPVKTTMKNFRKNFSALELRTTNVRNYNTMKKEKTACCSKETDYEATFLVLVGLLGIVNYFGWINLNPINWALLSPVFVLLLGLLMLSGLLHKLN